jgi:1,4-dihydroxy-2-naphthoyl-CoA synthase
MGKRAFYKTVDLDYRSAFEIANCDFSLLVNTEDGQEGIEAFLEKREADWKLK